MKRAFLDDARPDDVSHAVRGVVEKRGGLVAEHLSSRIRFTDRPRGQSWSREGYVGIYQPLGETSVELRLILRARWPWRLFWGIAAVNVVLFVLLFLVGAGANAWIFSAFLGGFALLAAGLVHLNTLQAVRDEERAWIEAFEEELRREIPAAELEDDLAHEQRQAELELEGEITQRRLAKLRKDAPRPPKPAGKRFSLRPGRKAPDEPEAPPEESPEERRARLLARKAELEAQRQGDGKS